MDQGPILQTIFHCNTNLMESLSCSHPTCTDMITSKFCTYHDSSAVMAHANFVAIWYHKMEVTLKPIIHKLITIEKLFMKLPPDSIIQKGTFSHVNLLWPSDVIWRQGSRSTLAQVMACCLTAPSHYLHQCWLMISEVLWHSPGSNFTESTSDICCWNEFEIY